MPGFTEADVRAAEKAHADAVSAGLASGNHMVTVGFGHEAVLGAAGVVIKAVEEKRLKHIFLIGKPARRPAAQRW